MENKKDYRQYYRQPAFPTEYDNGMNYVKQGMTLLDYFAAKAIPEVNEKPKSLYEWIKWCFGKNYASGYPDYSDIAKTAYKIAAAMMEERKKYL